MSERASFMLTEEGFNDKEVAKRDKISTWLGLSLRASSRRPSVHRYKVQSDCQRIAILFYSIGRRKKLELIV